MNTVDYDASLYFLDCVGVGGGLLDDFERPFPYRSQLVAPTLAMRMAECYLVSNLEVGNVAAARRRLGYCLDFRVERISKRHALQFNQGIRQSSGVLLIR